MYQTITVIFVMSYSVVKRQTQPLPYLDLRARDEWGGSRPLGCYLHWASVRSETQNETNASTIHFSKNISRPRMSTMILKGFCHGGEVDSLLLKNFLASGGDSARRGEGTRGAPMPASNTT